MSAGAISPGCVIHWENYTFSDGAVAHKYLVILGCKQGSNYLAVLGTSKRHKRSFTPGCNSSESYYHAPAGKAWFPLDTWLILGDPVEIEPAEFLKRAMIDKTLTIRGQMPVDIANAIRNCFKLCPDASAGHVALL